MKKSTTRITVIFILMIVGIVGYYAYLSGRTKEMRSDAAMTAVQSALSRDMQNDYPATPKEVIKYYNQILKCYYNEECSETEIDELGNRARELYDADLLAQNELETYLIRLKEDIQSYRDAKRKMTSASVAASTNVDYFEQDGFSFARIYSSYNIMEAGKNTSVNQVYLLRRDEDRLWKIYGWDLAQNVNPGEQK